MNDKQLVGELLLLQPKLRRFAFGMCQSRADADDIVQSSYERAFTRLDQWQHGTRADSWMLSIVRSVALNHLRGSRIRNRHTSDTEVEGITAIGTAQPDERLAFQEVTQAVARLPEDQREAVLLVSVEGLSYREAAEIIGISQAAFTSRLSRGRIALASFLADKQSPGKNTVVDFRSTP